jgi:NADPH:quinone reductase-like Zn-dependent oxidoreductase
MFGAHGEREGAMKAAVYRQFGGPDVVRIEEVPTPSPGPSDVLIRVHATTVSAADYRCRTRDVPKGVFPLVALAIGIFAPRNKILGFDLTGVVEKVGSDVTRYQVGDEVIALPAGGFGGHAQYRVLKETAAIGRKPPGWSFEDAVAILFGGHTADVFLHRTNVEAGQSVLVNGASGAVGTALVQLAKHRGATVTAVCSGGNAELVGSLGADRMIDYTKQDFAREGATYDAVFECAGNAPFERVEPILNPGGAYAPIIQDLRGMLTAAGQSRRTGKRIVPSAITPDAPMLDSLGRYAKLGALRPTIDRTYDLDDIVEAHRYVDAGRKRGSVVIRIP